MQFSSVCFHSTPPTNFHGRKTNLSFPHKAQCSFSSQPRAALVALQNGGEAEENSN